MKDIDFDELDKAVNSLMGSVAPDADEAAAKPKTLSISSTLKPDERPSYQKLDEVARTIGSETLTVDAEQPVVIEDLDAQKAAASKTPAMPPITPDLVPTLPVDVPDAATAPALPTAPQPAKGRFMDVVHPSSDMRSASLPPLQVPARDAVPHTAETVADEVTTPAEETSVEEVAASEPVPEEPVSSEPTLTPFLPDAKVEKRPLGAPPTPSGAVPSPFDDETPAETVAKIPEETSISPAGPAEETIAVNSETKLSVADDSQSVLDASVLPGASPEEAAAIAAIESSETVEEAAAPEVDEASIQAVESGDTEKLTTMRQAVKADLKADEPADKAGTIYDVDNQPQPLNHPAQQKSGLGTLVIIIVIIVIAAALGAAAYFALGLGS